MKTEVLFMCFFGVTFLSAIYFIVKTKAEGKEKKCPTLTLKSMERISM